MNFDNFTSDEIDFLLGKTKYREFGEPMGSEVLKAVTNNA